MTWDNDNKLDSKRIKDYIIYGNSIVRLYENTRRKYLEFHIGVMTFISIAISFFKNDLYSDKMLLLIIGTKIFYIFTFINIIFNLFIFGIKTKGIEKTNWHYRGVLIKENQKPSNNRKSNLKNNNIEKSKKRLKRFRLDLEENNLFEDDKKQYKNILIYQQKYFIYLTITRYTVLISTLILFICLFMNFLFLF
ncbi:MAG: hypothetical protein ACTSRP_05320 [Candidatus Helarchaeota archaeon]